MPYEIFLALRHLRSRQKRRLARVTSLIAVIGIAVGVAALIVALALSNGFRDEMRDKILRGTAHLTVMRSDGGPMPDYRDIATRIASVPGVVSMERPRRQHRTSPARLSLVQLRTFLKSLKSHQTFHG